MIINKISKKKIKSFFKNKKKLSLKKKIKKFFKLFFKNKIISLKKNIEKITLFSKIK